MNITRTPQFFVLLTVLTILNACASGPSHTAILNGRAQGICVMRQIPLWSGPEIFSPTNRSNCLHRNAQGLCAAVTLYSVDGCSNVRVEVLNETYQGKNRALLVRTLDLDVPKQGWVADIFVIDDRID